jgi:hypothetical protein
MLIEAAVALVLSGFSAHVDNPYFPLKPGTTYRYRGAEDGKRSLDVVTVTRRTRRIAGAPCRVVRDRLYLDGRLAEDTTDWYSQDRHGTVWYFGEATKELDRHGHVTSTEGSWRAGLHGATQGVFMPAHPRVGFEAAQEHFPGHAEDRFRVIRRDRRTVTTREWTPLEPGVVDHKRYVRGVGLVAERTVKGGSDHAELVSSSRAPAAGR